MKLTIAFNVGDEFFSNKELFTILAWFLCVELYLVRFELILIDKFLAVNATTKVATAVGFMEMNLCFTLRL